jgi:hypothetical protein
MGRVRQNNPRINCRIDKNAAAILAKVLERIPYGRQRPIGAILSRLILWTDDWPRIIKSFPEKPYVHNRKNWTRRNIEREMEEERQRQRKRDS